MITKKRSPLRQWEQEMIDAYHDCQWHLTLDPLYDEFQHSVDHESSKGSCTAACITQYNCIKTRFRKVLTLESRRTLTR
jgi:hypothetical protein